MTTSPHQGPRSLIVWSLSLIVKALLGIFLSLIMLILIIAVQWMETGPGKTKQNFTQLLQQQQLTLIQSPWGPAIVKTIQSCNSEDTVKQAINKAINNLSHLSLDKDKWLATWINNNARNINDTFQTIFSVTSLWLLRWTTVVLFLPVFLALGPVACIDGLVQRDLRKLQGGRESALIYHRARKCILPLLFWGSFLYVVLPFNVMPDVCLMPFAVLFAFVLFLTTKTFKKYL